MRSLEEKYAAVHDALIEWGLEHFYPGWAEASPSSALARYAGRRPSSRALALKPYLEQEYDDPVPCHESRSARMELFVHDGDAMMCKPDGGALHGYLKLNAAIERSRRCRVLGELLDLMPRQLWNIVRVKYRDCTRPMEIPRGDVQCLGILNIPERTFYYRKRAAFIWLDTRLYPRRPAPAPAATA